MPYVQIPKDLTQVKTKVALNLTKRQIVCFAGAAATAFPFYLLTNGIFGTTGSALGILVVAFPWFAFALYERDGQPLEKYLMNVIQARFLRPRVRKYQTQNFYSYLQEQVNISKEVTASAGAEIAATGKKSKTAQRAGRAGQAK